MQRTAGAMQGVGSYIGQMLYRAMLQDIDWLADKSLTVTGIGQQFALV